MRMLDVSETYRNDQNGVRSNQSPNFKLLRSPKIDSKESIQPAYIPWRAGMSTLFLVGSLPP
jgi:hypothetical protein